MWWATLSWPAELGLVAAAMVGHFSLSVWLFNRLHAIGWPRPLVKALEKLLVLAAFAVLFWLAARGPGWLVYAVVCWPAAVLAIPCWLIPKLTQRTPAALMANDTTLVDVAKRLGFRPLHGSRVKWLGGIPGNEILRIAVQQKRLAVPNLPPELAGLKIAHLSDLHMTGQLGREFYDCVVDLTNDWRPDIVAITGDILEKEQCLPWILPTLGQLEAPQGKFFVVGNHEMRLREVAPLRRLLEEAGFKDLGSRSVVQSVRGCPVLLAGVELPWFGSAPEIDGAAAATSTQHSGRGTREPVKGQGEASHEPPFRILLSHSPDQFAWAKSREFDVMLAGHTHGGQIRLPLIGALIAPSWHGSYYAGGTYYERPTLLHVSRGLAGIHPIRWNCPPELALLTLVTKATDG
jgi:predicted MPP superfamily phosphohydrolase